MYVILCCTIFTLNFSIDPSSLLVYSARDILDPVKAAALTRAKVRLPEEALV